MLGLMAIGAAGTAPVASVGRSLWGLRYQGPESFVRRHGVKNLARLIPGVGHTGGKLITRKLYGWPSYGSIAATALIGSLRWGRAKHDMLKVIEAVVDPDKHLEFDPQINPTFDRLVWGDMYDIWNIISTGGDGPGEIPTSIESPPPLREAGKITADLSVFKPTWAGSKTRAKSVKKTRSSKRCPPGHYWNGRRCVKR